MSSTERTLSQHKRQANLDRLAFFTLFQVGAPCQASLTTYPSSTLKAWAWARRFTGVETNADHKLPGLACCANCFIRSPSISGITRPACDCNCAHFCKLPIPLSKRTKLLRLSTRLLPSMPFATERSAAPPHPKEQFDEEQTKTGFADTCLADELPFAQLVCRASPYYRWCIAIVDSQPDPQLALNDNLNFL